MKKNQSRSRLALGDREKTAFITEWGAYVSEVMTFGLKSAQATFQRAAYKIFEKQLEKNIMRIFVDDFTVFGKRDKHLDHLRECLDQCRTTRMCLNPLKCAFGVRSGILLGQIVSVEGIAMDPSKVEVI